MVIKTLAYLVSEWIVMHTEETEVRKICQYQLFRVDKNI